MNLRNRFRSPTRSLAPNGLLIPAFLLALLLTACASSQSALPGVPSPEVAASTASQPEPEASDPSQGGGQGTGGSEQGEAGEGGSEGEGESSEGDGSEAGSKAGDGSSGAEQATAGDAAATGESAAATGAPPPTGPATTNERAEKLEQALDESLAEFDSMLLREQEAIEQRRAENAETTAASASGGGTGEGGSEASSSPTGSAKEARGRSQSRGGDAGSAAPEGEPEPLDEEMASRVPEDVGDGRDDDIVARQLREAAMKEDDPELREKLWDEYRTYKQSSGD